MLRGDLALFSLGEVFQSLAVNTHSGTLKICSPEGKERLICFQRGEIVYYSDDARINRVPQIGEILVRMQFITQAQLEEALQDQRTRKGLLGKILIKKGMASEDDLRKVLETQALEGLYTLFLQREGTFEFQMNVLPKTLQKGIWKQAPIALNTQRVIMEGLRQLDEWVTINRHVLTFDEIFRRVDLLAATPTDLAGFLLELCNGIRPVRELFLVYPHSRFECAKLICQFIQSGLIRPLTEDECLKLADEKLNAKQFQQAASFLTFAAQLHPVPKTYVCLGDALAGAFQEAASGAAYVQALRLAYEQEDFQTVGTIAEKLLPKGKVDDSDLERIFFSYVRLQNFKRAASTGNQLVAIRQKSGSYEQAAVVMETIAAMDPSDLNLKIQAATLFEKAGNVELATRELEQVVLVLEGDKRYRELIKILRFLSQINPKRQDFKQKLASTQSRIDQLDRRNKFRVTLTGFTLIAALVLAIVPFLYEVKAREYFGHAQSLEQTAMLTSDFTRAKEAYTNILKSYSFSTKVAEAQEGLERILQVERTYLSRMELQTAARKEEYDSKMFAIKEELSGRLKEAEDAERAEDFLAAHRLYRQIVTDFTDVLVTKKISFPLRITTEPSGATVSINGAEVGKSPIVHRYQPGTNINLSLTRTSCVPLQQSIELQDQWELHFKLSRKPLGEFTPVAAIHQPMVTAAKRIVVASRDGHLYGVDPTTKVASWQRVVGRYGDRISELETRGDEVYLGNVSGEVSAISAKDGKSRWIARVDSSVIAAPAVSLDGSLVAVGTTSGLVHILSNENGASIAKITTDNEIVAKPLFAGPLLLTGSTDNTIYAYSVELGKVVAETELPDDIVADLTPDDAAFLTATADGCVYRLNSSSLRVLWARPLGKPLSTAIRVSAEGVYVGTAAGLVFMLDKQTGETRWKVSAGTGGVTGITPSEKFLYITLESGRIAALDHNKGDLGWTYQSDISLLAPPILLDGILYAGGMTGKFQYMEMIE